MHDHRVGAVVEFLADTVNTLLRRPRRRRFQPFLRYQRRDVFDLLRGGLVVDTTRNGRHHRVFPKALQHSGIPIVGRDHQVPVTLQIGGQPRDGLLQPEFFGKVVTDGGEARPYPHAVGIAARLFGGDFHRLDAAPQCLGCEVGVQNDVVERPTAQRQGVGPECDDRQSDVFVEVGIKEQHLVLADRPVVVEDQLTAPESAHDLCEVLHLRGRHRRYAECAVHRGHPPADAERESSAGEPVHGRCPRAGDQRVTCVVIGCRGGDLHAFVTAHAAPTSDDASLTFQRSEMNAVPKPSSSPRRASSIRVAGPSPPAPASR